MRNCFNNIMIALNFCDSLHLVFAIMDAVRNSFGEHEQEKEKEHQAGAEAGA